MEDQQKVIDRDMWGGDGDGPAEPDTKEPDIPGSDRDRWHRALNIIHYGREQPLTGHTLSRGLNQWKNIAGADGRAEDTVEGVEGAVKLLQEYLGDVPLTAVTPQEMRRFVGALRLRHPWQNHPYVKTQANKYLSPGTINNRVRAIKSMFGTLAREKLIAENPLRDYHAPGVEESNPATLSSDQMRLLLSQPDQSRREQFRDFVIMSLFYDSKCRLSELAAMEVDRLDLQGTPPNFTVLGKGRGKGPRWLTYYFSPLGAKLLSRYLAARPQPAPGVKNVFLRYDGQRLTAARIYCLVKHYGEKAVLKVYPHIFRHSGAKEHLRHGGNLPELQVLLNHKTLRSTMIYSKMDSDDARRAVARFSALMALGVIPRGRKRSA